jgi:biopolymer transport protein TolR
VTTQGSSKTSGSRMAMSEINVTPFVDVMLVLLIIFMVTAPMMQQGLDVNLPKTASTGVALNEDPFVISINASGKINLGDNEISPDTLKQKVKAIFENRKNKQIYIQADKKVDYGTVAYVMGEIRMAGITNISLITLPKE